MQQKPRMQTKNRNILDVFCCYSQLRLMFDHLFDDVCRESGKLRYTNNVCVSVWYYRWHFFYFFFFLKSHIIGWWIFCCFVFFHCHCCFHFGFDQTFRVQVFWRRHFPSSFSNAVVCWWLCNYLFRCIGVQRSAFSARSTIITILLF